MGRAIHFQALSCVIVAAASATVASAQEPAPVVVGQFSTVLPANMDALLAPGTRRYTPGIPMGSFIVQPLADISVVYDDNVLSDNSRRQSDTITRANASVDVVSDWSRHALEFFVGGGGSLYADTEDENQAYATVGVGGLLDIHQGFWIRAGGKYSIAPEARGFGESTSTFDSPIITQTVQGNLVAHREFNRLWLELGGGAQRQSYRDAELAGVTVDQSFRDGNIYNGVARVGYEVSPRTSLFVESGGSTRNFTDNRFEGDQYNASLGFRYELTRLVSGEAAIGYMHFDSSGGLSDSETWSYRGHLAWDPTPLVSVALVGSRDLGSPVATGGASNTIDSNLGVRADYAFRRDVTLSAGIGYGWLEFIDVNRTDTYLKLTTGAEYEFRSSLSLWANYAFSQSEADAAAAADYDKNVVMFGLRAKY
jgi:hypothetical protein